MVRRGVAAALLVAGLTFASCHRGGSAARDGQQRRPLDTVTVNFHPTFAYAPLLIAREEHYFEQEGIDASFVSLDMNSAVFALAAGKLDTLTMPQSSGIFNLMLEGGHVQIVADAGHSAPGPCAAEAFAAPPATVERIARTRTLKGEKFAIVRAGNTEYLIEKFLAQYGLKMSDIEIAQMPRGDYATKNSKQIDAIRYMKEPSLSNATADHTLAIVATSEQVAPGLQLSVVAYGPRLLRNPDVGRRFMRAYVRGIRRYNEGKTDRNVALLSQFMHYPPEIVRQTCWQRIASDGRVKREGVEPMLDWALARGYLNSKVPVETWWNGTFTDAASGK